jgi:glycosyl transferase, family 25
MVPVFVINLERSVERLAAMTLRCSEIGISFERFSAVSGTDLPPALKPYFCDVSGRIVSPLRPAEIGCYASHLGVWQLILERRVPAALICEDDAVPPHGIDAIITEIMSSLDGGWDMVLLSSKPVQAFRPLASLANGGSLVRYSKVPSSLACYLISNSGAAKMLQPVAPRMWMNDHDSRFPWKFGMETYGVYPPPARLSGDKSTINSTGRRGTRSGLRRGIKRSPFRTPQSFLFNLHKLGPYWWTRCFAINCAVKAGKLLVPLRRGAARAATRAKPI